MGELNKEFAGIKEAFIAMFPPPPVQGLGTIGGFKLQIEDRAGLGYEALNEATKAFMAKAATAPELAGMFSSYPGQRAAALCRYRPHQGAPARRCRDRCVRHAADLSRLVYVNDFNKFGRTYSVRVQADAPFRARPRISAS
jgi:multidrug efflux pump